MARTKLTDAFAARAELPPGKAEVLFQDPELVGFGLRIRGGSKTWIITYRPLGLGRAAAPKRFRLGSFEKMTALKARNEAKIALGKVASGLDPLAERQEQKRKSLSTIELLLEGYDADLERRGYINRKVVIAGLRNRLRPLLNRDVAEITGREIADIIAATKRAGLVGAAEDFRSRCRAFLGWCVASAKVLPSNPLAGHRKERATRADRIAQTQHGRALSDAELAKLWAAANLRTSFGRYIRFLILTGCRRSEGAGLTWSMIDRGGGTITMPASFVKQGRRHVVPISVAVADLLDHCPVDARSDLVFGSSKTGMNMSGWSQLVARINRSADVAFDLHDLRRTMRTGLSRLGVSTEVAELALGHARTELEQIYNRDGAVDALRAASELWTQHVSRLQPPADPCSLVAARV